VSLHPTQILQIKDCQEYCTPTLDRFVKDFSQLPAIKTLPLAFLLRQPWTRRILHRSLDQGLFGEVLLCPQRPAARARRILMLHSRWARHLTGKEKLLRNLSGLRSPHILRRHHHRPRPPYASSVRFIAREELKCTWSPIPVPIVLL